MNVISISKIIKFLTVLISCQVQVRVQVQVQVQVQHQLLIKGDIR